MNNEPETDARGRLIEALMQGLRFYADRHHFALSDASAWDTVSGEPQNFWCDDAGTATVEDGQIARMAMAGQYVPWDVESGELPLPANARNQPPADREAG